VEVLGVYETVRPARGPRRIKRRGLEPLVHDQPEHFRGGELTEISLDMLNIQGHVGRRKTAKGVRG